MSSCWLLVMLFTISCHAENDILKSCPESNDCKSDDNALKQFLSSCIKTPAHIQQVQKKLEDEGIDYDTLFQVSEDDIRATFKEIGIRSWHTGLIISKLHNIKGSGVEKYPSHSATSSIVVLNNEQNKYILQLNQNIANVKSNIAKLENNMIEINQSAENITLQINQHYQELYKILSTQKALTLSKLNEIKARKLRMTTDQKLNASKALKYLENANMNLSQIINNVILDLAEKQFAITELIDTSQQVLLKYDCYLQHNMTLITQPVIKYSTKETFLFAEFVQKMNNVFDVDINFNDIRFDEMSIFIDWNTDLFYLNKDLKFDVEFNRVEANKTKEWKVLHRLGVNETEIQLDSAKIELLERFTEYEFRIKVIFLNHEIYSQILNSETKELYTYPVFPSTLLTNKEKAQLVQWISNGMNRQFELLFRASRDGFTAGMFHQKCDDKGETLVIVKSEMNHVFGGYTTKSWKHVGWSRDENAWIYLLRSSRNDLPQKWSCKKPKYAIYAHSSYGPIFGGGHDFSLSDRCNENSNSGSNLGHSYSAPQDNKKLAGSYNFKCIDYEVWKLI